MELERLPQRIADLRARVEAIAADIALRDAHAPQMNAHGDKPFSFIVDGRVYADRVDTAPAFAAAIERGVDESFSQKPGLSLAINWRPRIHFALFQE